MLKCWLLAAASSSRSAERASLLTGELLKSALVESSWDCVVKMVADNGGRQRAQKFAVFGRGCGSWEQWGGERLKRVQLYGNKSREVTRSVLDLRYCNRRRVC